MTDEIREHDNDNAAPEKNTEPDQAGQASEPLRPWVIKDVQFEKSGSRRSHFPREPRLPQVAFVGRSNVGKSSLLNVLVNRKRLAKVSNTPGRTQLVNFFMVNGDTRLVDLPGYGFAKAPKEVKAQWDKMITGYLLKNPDLRLVVTLFDVRRDPTPEDASLLDWLNHYEIPFLAVLTKADKLTRSGQMQARKKISQWLEPWNPAGIVLFSASSRLGRDDVLKEVGRALAEEPESEVPLEESIED